MNWSGARKDPKQSAIVDLRQQLQMIEKKEEHLQKEIDEELKKAKTNAVTNKAVATAALKRKRMNETELDRLAEIRLQLEMQVNTSESAAVKELAYESSTTLADPPGVDPPDEEGLLAQLNMVEQEHLDERLQGANDLPSHQTYREPGERVEAQTVNEEEEELRQLEASIAM